MEFVVVRHPDIDEPAEVSLDAFNAVYREKGWVVVDEPAPVPAEPASNPADTEVDADEAPAPADSPAPSSPQVV